MGQGGAEKIVFQICMDKRNDKVVASSGGFYVEKLEENSIKNYIIPDIDKKNPFLMMKTLFILLKIVKKEKIEIIHSHHRMAAFYAQLIHIFNRKIKLIYTAHNVFLNKKILLKFSLKNTKIVAVGNGVYNNLTEYYGIDKNNVTIIYNSIEPNISGKNNEILNSLNGRILIGTIGRLSEQKGIDIFLKAIKKIIDENNDVYGVIIGDGEKRTEYENLAKKLEIDNNIVFLGFQRNIFDIIKQLDFVVLASRWEGFPLTPIETFSMKKTIIASNIDGNNEIVIHMKNGLIFKKEDIKDLTEKMNILMHNKDLKKKLEENAYEDFKNKYSYKVFIDGYQKIYEDCEEIKDI